MADLVFSFLDLLLFKAKTDFASPVFMVFFSEDSFSMWSGASTFMASMLGVLSQFIVYPVLKGSDGLFVTARGPWIWWLCDYCITDVCVCSFWCIKCLVVYGSFKLYL